MVLVFYSIFVQNFKEATSLIFTLHNANCYLLLSMSVFYILTGY
ncbi:hypothetical protein X975_21198, partial [Stegodyphus mimosarum]